MRTQTTLAAIAAVFIMQTTQLTRVELTKRTPTDDESVHVTAFYKEPKESLIFPDVDRTQALFFDVFYSRDIEDDAMISAMVLKKKDRDELYIDVNNDENLTNDGSPFLFYYNQNDFLFDIVSSKDSLQVVKILLQRRPFSRVSSHQPDSLFVDKEGNLKQALAMIYSRGASGFEGKKGTFYFDTRVTLSRGEMQLGDTTYQVGLLDYNNNGLFNDVQNGEASDLILVDLDGDGKLSFEARSEVFKLNDVIPIGKQNYKIAEIDPYGRYLKIVKTNEAPTFYYLKEVDKRRSAQPSPPPPKLDDSFWALELKSLDGKELKISQFKGKYLLLNFWGEWCKPCVFEIPELVEAYNKIPREKFDIISFLYSSDLEAARRMIMEKKMTWHHTILTEELREQSKIKSYPTNILLAPNGTIAQIAYQINQVFLFQFVR